MADYRDIFKDPENQNWVKCALAVHITREGLSKFVENEISQFQHSALHSIIGRNPRFAAGALCNSCSTCQILQCPTPNVCKIRRGNCMFHNIPARPCPNGICDQMKIEIQVNHSYPNPSWKNTDAKSWCTNSWQIAKCYMPPDGYSDVQKVEGTDFNGIVNVILNCKRFDNLRNQASSATLFNDARDVGKMMRHRPQVKMDTGTATANIKTLQEVLRNPCLAGDQTAQNALQNLIQLEQDTLSITSEDALKVLEEFKSMVKEVSDEMRKEITNLQSELVKYKERNSKDYETLKTDLQDDLIKFYKRRKHTVQLSPEASDMDVPLDKIYVPSAITFNPRRLQSKKDSGNGSLLGHEVETKESPLQNYQDIFCYKGTTSKHIYIKGEAGSGKSTFSTRITQDWCEAVAGSEVTSREYFSDVEYLETFQFLFFISLREIGKDICDINEMIHHAIINECVLAKQYSPDFLTQCLKDEPILIILDGLDEWTHPNGVCQRTPTVIPHHSAGTQCTYLTFTRPWKLNDEEMKESYIDVLFDIKGVVSTSKLLENVLEHLNTKYGTQQVLWNKTVESKLQALLNIPITAMQLLCLWYENNSLPDSKAQLYSEMIDMFLHRSNHSEKDVKPSARQSRHMPECFKTTTFCESYIDLLDHLGELAFHSLYSEDKRSQTVFPGMFVDRYLSPIEKKMALECGILTQHKVPSLVKTKSTFCFQHKTYQEFMAAYFLATHDEKDDTSLRAMELFCDQKFIFRIEECFQFVCEMNIKSVVKLTELMWKQLHLLSDEFFEVPGYWEKFDDETGNLQLLLLGQKELLLNFSDSELKNLPVNAVLSEKLCHSFLSRMRSVNVYMTGEPYMGVQIWPFHDKVSKSVFSSVVYIHLRSEIFSGLENLKLLEQAKSLQSLRLQDITIDITRQSFMKNNSGSVRSEDNQTSILHPCLSLSSSVKTFICLGITIKSDDKQLVNNFIIDLEKCTNLQYLSLYNVDCTVKLKSSELKKCSIANYNLVNGDILECLVLSSILRCIKLKNCSNVSPVCVSLSNKSTLHTLQLDGGLSAQLDLGDINMLLPDCVRYLNISRITMTPSSWSKMFECLSPGLEMFTMQYVILGDICAKLPNTLRYILINSVSLSPISWCEMFKMPLPQLEELSLNELEMGDKVKDLPQPSKRLSLCNIHMVPEAWCNVLGNLREDLAKLEIESVNIKTADLDIRTPRSLRSIVLSKVTLNLKSWAFLNSVANSEDVTLKSCRVSSSKDSISWLKHLKKTLKNLCWDRQGG